MKRLVVALLLLLLAEPLTAQPRTRLRLTGFTGNFGNTLLADFDQGYKESAAMIYTVDITRDNAARSTSVLVRANAATMGATKPVAEILWRRSDLLVWVPLTTVDAEVESQTIAGNGTAWSNSMVWRVLLDWDNESLGLVNVIITFTLVVAAP